MSAGEVLALRREGKHEEARELAVALVQAAPGDAELQYETACVHDYLGLEAEAVPFYRAALAGRLDPARRRGAFLGLGSTLRVLGQYPESEEVLATGLGEFPDANELKVFLAMTLHNLGRSKDAVELLLRLVAATSADPEVRAYGGAIDFYAQDVERTWP
ncbi:MAG: tetratricopeptide repeat protein [Betaproteobacteria bacterium]|jgi:tetratricopeptide (TPR) repeat protein|nr:tetratricopeptide repeat protein [Betaproteobacteria bacterium]MDH5285609.1 tetratricopeptide repeat protein [Betaproteobacteria bacterium]